MNIERVAVIGAGVMGSGIAAQVANAGIAVYLLDLPAQEGSNRNAIAEAAIAKLLTTEPPPLMLSENVGLIHPGNNEDDLFRLAEVDWVIEAVVENPAVKRDLYRKLDKVCRPGTLISSNTSSLPLHVLTQELPDSFKRRFLITHFFNPPRYMRLLELVTSSDLAPEALDRIRVFADQKLGKGCVLCHDTPGFIANRIGTFWIQTAIREAIALNLSVEQSDAVMTLFGIPKTGVFGLLDLVGLDLMPHILKSFLQTLPAEDKLRDIAAIPSLMTDMIEQGYTGRKGKGGFYRLKPGSTDKIKESIDLKNGDYHTSEKFRIEDVGDSPESLRKFLAGDGSLNRYAWRVWSETLTYCAELIPEIADDIVSIDDAMLMGYNWRYGPFQLLDRFGVDWFAQRLRDEGRPAPSLLTDGQSFYRFDKHRLQFKHQPGHYRPLPIRPGVLSLNALKHSGEALLHNASASLWDIGDGIVCFEFHSKMNTLDPDSLTLLSEAAELIRQDFQGLVIYNEGENFSAGANLKLLAPSLMQQDWQAVDDILRLGQQSYAALKYAPFPVVGAPTGLALGGGCEILLHCDAIQAHAELYVGLVETGVGLVPGWGGCKELLRRWLEFPKRPGGPMPAIAQCFETIALAKVSQSAFDAKKFLFLDRSDGITMNKERLLADAKALALSLTENYSPPEPYEFYLPGASAQATLDIAVRNQQQSGKASAYDGVIARQLAHVLCGDDTDITLPLSEQGLLDLEREAFLHLVQQPGTQARLEHLLKTGKPLRN
ncbi:3-hydroxyacyl-CoA dehydrogenase NAD-binding domain-containing protein [Methylomarinum sp. Ch1-1]|uniref:3-hydroxyacyl-CoA dehydrogenase NAD-binding domain-containing protein n=1 Tax=Methylomarinum roseum TaxID=3067653 RepID=A0AAU7NR17_9GAMM|nr:3-hydroxyacyl-CoA dehydrogenase/enoyl-CoA hydratase family protein [Methylomarinum sp. Ch1-1]MDP4520611.1 3-hydroxyacyl-CoA dehydrogenase NAD-binding domain-containing protein [Methylomarinum sp. Ch1-1]